MVAGYILVYLGSGRLSAGAYGHILGRIHAFWPEHGTDRAKDWEAPKDSVCTGSYSVQCAHFFACTVLQYYSMLQHALVPWGPRANSFAMGSGIFFQKIPRCFEGAWSCRWGRLSVLKAPAIKAICKLHGFPSDRFWMILMVCTVCTVCTVPCLGQLCEVPQAYF